MVMLNLKRLFQLRKPEVIGLDIGSASVKAVQLHKDHDGYTVKAAAIVPFVSGAEPADEAAVVGAVRQCIASIQATRGMAVCGISGKEVAVRHFRFPMLPPDEMDSAVQLEASQACPFKADEQVVDYQLVNDGAGGVSGLLVAATKRIIRHKTALVGAANVNCVLLDVDGLALLNCFHEYHNSPEGRATAILNAGSSCATVAISGPDRWPFIRDIPYAGGEVISKVAVDKLILAVAETLRSYNSQETAPPVDRIFLCGGCAMVSGFAELLDQGLTASVEVWNPFDSVRCDAPRRCLDTIEAAGPALAVAAGLAMRTI